MIRPCQEGVTSHPWDRAGLDIVPAGLFPNARAYDGFVLCRVRRCYRCALVQAKVYPKGSTWKDIG